MNEELRNEIIHRSLRGQSHREIARKLHVSRNTIKAVLSELQRAREGASVRIDRPAQETNRPSMLDPYDPVLTELILRYPEIPAVQVQRQLQAIGCEASYTIVRQRVKLIRQQVSRGHLDSSTAPGAVGQVTCRRVAINKSSEGQCLANLFVFRLVYSGCVYLRFTARNDLATVLYEHVGAFEFFHGAAATVEYDNVPVARLDGQDSSIVFHPTFLRFASHYGFRPTGASQNAAREESLVACVRDSLLQHRQYRSLDHANDALRTWVSHELKCKMDHAAARLDARQDRESNHLIPLPHHPWPG